MPARRRPVAALASAAILGALLIASPETTAVATPVATNNALYAACGRVFPDPHAYWPSPAQSPGRSPYAKGNAACQASDFMSYAEMVGGMTYMERLLPDFVEFFNLEEEFGDGSDCATSTDLDDLCSVGLPRQGAPSASRVKSDLWAIRVTDERVADTDKKFFVFPLSIHGIERAGAEAGTRGAEDLATWGYCEAKANGEAVAPPGGPAAGATINCANEAPIPHPLMEAQPGGSITAGAALRSSVIYFIYPNPDGWRRGDPDNLTRFFQRYNGNGVDLNRDWPTQGYTFRPYTPWSEPESRAFGQALEEISDEWAGGIDLHGQLIDRAFSFTLMGASQRDFAKNQRILQAVKGAWADAEQRLGWSPLIKPNDAPPACEDVDPGEPCDERIYGVQWGTVWDSINYTVTGAVGDWIDSPIGLNADGIDNEMSLSHLSNCGVGSCYLKDAEQLHVDGNKSLVYAMVNFTLLPEDNRFRVPDGKVGYIFNPKVASNPGNLVNPPPHAGLSPQPDIMNAMLSPANNFRFAFDIKGPNAGFYNGGVSGVATANNVGGISGSSVSSLILERRNPAEPPVAEDNGCGAAGDNWEEVNRYYNQASTYAQGGQAVHGNLPTPGQYRICLTGSVAQSLVANGGFMDLDIFFTEEKAWEDPGQVAYSVTNMRFFRDLAPFLKKGQLVKVTAAQVLSSTFDLDQFNSLVLADDPFPTSSLTSPQATQWANRLEAFVQGGGNLVLTDGAMPLLAKLGVVAQDKVLSFKQYAGYIGFTDDGGSTATYDDPLARNINQPGAAEGAGHRHQTYEPVPLGFDIGDRSSCSESTTCTAPHWGVNQQAWEAAGGRTVGTSGTNRVTLGEVEVGSGVIRIIGALLPFPSEQYYHPFGLANYALTYSGYQVLNNALNWSRTGGCPGFESDTRSQIVGTPGNDQLVGSTGPEILCGLGGQDELIGGSGDDLLLGGDGADTLKGSFGDDLLKGEAGNDTLNGGEETDRCEGGPGADGFRRCEVQVQ